MAIFLTVIIIVAVIGLLATSLSLRQVQQYQRGVVLVKYCREALGQVAQRVRILEADLLQPFEAADDDDA